MAEVKVPASGAAADVVSQLQHAIEGVSAADFGAALRDGDCAASLETAVWDGQPPVCWAAQYGSDRAFVNLLEAIIEILGEKNAARIVARHDDLGQTPLHIAARLLSSQAFAGARELGDKLRPLRQLVFETTDTEFGRLPIHEAAAAGNGDVFAWLLQKKPDLLERQDNDGHTPLELAWGSGWFNILRIAMCSSNPRVKDKVSSLVNGWRQSRSTTRQQSKWLKSLDLGKPRHVPEELRECQIFPYEVATVGEADEQATVWMSDSVIYRHETEYKTVVRVVKGLLQYSGERTDMVAVKTHRSLDDYTREVDSCAHLHGRANMLTLKAHGKMATGTGDHEFIIVTELATKTAVKATRDEARAVITAVADALRVMHERKLVHCDVKPANIFLVDGAWKLGDFDSVSEPGKPRGGYSKGYIQIERIKQRAETRDDVYALYMTAKELGLPLGENERVPETLDELMARVGVKG